MSKESLTLGPFFLSSLLSGLAVVAVALGFPRAHVLADHLSKVEIFAPLSAAFLALVGLLSIAASRRNAGTFLKKAIAKHVAVFKFQSGVSGAIAGWITASCFLAMQKSGQISLPQVSVIFGYGTLVSIFPLWAYSQIAPLHDRFCDFSLRERCGKRMLLWFGFIVFSTASYALISWLFDRS